MRSCLFLICLLFCIKGQASLTPVPYRGQEMSFFKGTPYVSSYQNGSNVTLISLDRDILKNKASFSFKIENNGSEKVHFLEHDLKVFDQLNGDVLVVPKEQLLTHAKNWAWWSRIYSSLNLLIDQWYASDYGTIRLKSKHPGHDITFFSPGVVKNTRDMAQLKDERRREKITNEEKEKVGGYEEHYFGSHTILPGESYAANFQIDLFDEQMPNLEHLYFVFSVGDDQHVFSFRYRPDTTSSWWWPF